MTDMKVLHVFKGYRPHLEGGVIEVIRQLGQATIAEGCESRVLVGGPRREMTRDGGLEVQFEPVWPSYAGVGVSRGMLKAFARHAADADVVHYHAPWPTGDFMHLMLASHRPSIVTYHSDLVSRNPLVIPCNALHRRFLRSVDCIVATSPMYVRTSPMLAPLAERVEVIPLGIDRGDYPAADSAQVQKIREQMGGAFALFIGVLRSYKGIDVLLEALQQTQVPCVIAGDGPLRRLVASRVGEAGLRNVIWSGAVSAQEKSNLLAACSVLVLPSNKRSEAFGIVLLEAAMHGRALITCEIGTATSWVNQHGETGLVTPSSDPQALGLALRHIVGSPAEAARMGTAAASRFESHFTLNRMVRAYMDHYRRLVAMR